MINWEKFLDSLPTFLVDGKEMIFKEHEIDRIFNCHPIILAPKGMGNEQVEPLDYSIPLDLPFKTCFFEYINRPVTNLERGFDITGIYISENSPRDYHLLFLVESKHGQLIHFSSDKKIQEHLLGIVRDMLKRFYSEKLGQASPRRSVKVKTPSGKVRHRINKVIYVSPKSQIDSLSESEGRDINWSHRWYVRGHWRSIPGKIGKDREEKLIPNWTWVTEHIKGPENIEVIKKPHIVK